MNNFHIFFAMDNCWKTLEEEGFLLLFSVYLLLCYNEEPLSIEFTCEEIRKGLVVLSIGYFNTGNEAESLYSPGEPPETL